MNRIRLAHLSDLHLPVGGRPRWRDLLCKRFFSWLSWTRHRSHIHRPEVLALLMQDVRASAPDHLAVTGDLTNLALPREFAQAHDWLAAQGSGEAVTAIPGNHDALVEVDPAEGLGLWAEWMGGATAFPFVKRLGEAALVGVSSAIPTGLFLAGGRIDRGQLDRLEALLGELGREGLFRILLIHHPITEGAVSKRKALWNQAEVRAVLARAGCELVLHGHSHLSAIESTPGPNGPIPVVAAPSASADPHLPGEPAGWSRIDIAPTNAAWTVEISIRVLGVSGDFAVVRTQTFQAPRPAL